MSNFLKNQLEVQGFKITEISGEILLVEDFLSKKDLDDVFNIIKRTPEEKWNIEYLKNLKRFCKEKFGREDVENLVSEGKFEITQNWSDKNLNFVFSPIYKTIHSKLDSVLQTVDSSQELSGFATIQRMQPNVELKSHTDQHTDPSITTAAIIYLNDDYTNGELFFKNKDIQLKPKPGSLVLFPGNEEYEHGVKIVGDGPIRYVVVGFIKIKNFYENNKY